MAGRIGLALVVLLLTLPAAASADTSFLAGDTTSQLTARGTALVYDAPSGGTHQRLRQGFGSSARNLPIKRATGFFGVHFGTDSRGGRVLVYARCKGGRCDLFSYLYATKRERKLRSVSRSACTERDPVLVHGTLVFVRETRHSRKPRRRCAGGIYYKRPRHPLRRIAKTVPENLDFDGHSMVYERQIGPVDPNPEGDTNRSQIRVLRPGKHSRLLLAATTETDRGGNTGTFLSEPVLAAGRVYVVRTVQSEEAQTTVDDVVRKNADGTGATQVLARSGRLWVDHSSLHQDSDLMTVAVEGARLYYVYGQGRIGLVAGPPVFH